MLNVERHIFGSWRGYTTLARSSGVSAADCRALESMAFSFGQVSAPEFFASLAGNPSFFVREMPADRRCLTRVVAGKADDNNRPTLRFVSAIVDRKDWDMQLFGDLRFLLGAGELWKWNGNAEIGAISLSPPAPKAVAAKSVPRLIALVSRIESELPLRGRIVVSADDYTSREMALLEMLIPRNVRPIFSLSCRTPNPQFPALVNAIEASTTSPAVTFCFTGDNDRLSRYATMLKEKLSSGFLPLEEIMTYGNFGREAAPQFSRSPAAPPPRRSRQFATAPFILLIVFSILTSAVSYVLGRVQTEQDLGRLQNEVAQLNTTSQKLQSDIGQLQASSPGQGSGGAGQNQLKSQVDDLSDAIGQANVRAGKDRDEYKARFASITRSISNLQSRLLTDEQALNNLQAGKQRQGANSQTQDPQSIQNAAPSSAAAGDR